MATRSTTEQAVGAAIRALRMRKEWTLAELGRRVKRSRQYVQRVEAGEIAPPISVYAVFARALGVELADLLPGSSARGGAAGDPTQHS
jgi:transcriptional regulator with XRE-family HTH domain